MKNSVLPKLRRVLARLQSDPVNRRLECLGLQADRIGLVITKKQAEDSVKVLEIITGDQVSEIESSLIYAPAFCSTWISSDASAMQAALKVSRQLARKSNRISTRQKREGTSFARRERKFQADL